MVPPFFTREGSVGYVIQTEDFGRKVSLYYAEPYAPLQDTKLVAVCRLMAGEVEIFDKPFARPADETAAELFCSALICATRGGKPPYRAFVVT